MTLVSYAQNREDVVLWRALGHVESGFYIDVGSYDPTEDSVTRAFYDRGWRGINIEPVRAYHDKFVAERTRDINLNVAATARAGLVRFNTVVGTGLSSTLDEVAARATADGRTVESTDVAALTLTSICEGADVQDIHFLKIDVEGGEHAVLEGADFSRFRPWVVVVEATVPLSSERNDHLWRDLLLDAGYRECLFDGLNLFFVAEEHGELAAALSVPACVLDDYISYDLLQLREQVAERDGKLAALSAQLSQQTLAAEKLRAEVASLRERIEALNATVIRLGKERDAARAELATVQVQLRNALNQYAAEQGLVYALRSSTSWRLTAPVRAISRLVKRETPPKELARVAFHRSMRLMLSVPGVKPCVRIAHRMIPGPTRWLALHYRAYEVTYGEAPSDQSTVGIAQTAPLPSATVPTELSSDEARLLRRLATAIH